MANARTFVRNIVMAGLVSLAPLISHANDLVPPDPWQLIHSVRDLGPAEVGKDDFKDPQINADLAGADGAPRGLPYAVSFYGCDQGRGCMTILLSLRLLDEDWQQEPPPDEKFADWNREKLVGRAWRDTTGHAVLDHVVVIGAGIPKKMLAETLSAWQTAIVEFVEHLDFKPKN